MLLIEPAIVSDIFASELALIEDLQDGCVRFTYAARQKSTHEHNGAIEHVIVARLILPLPAVLAARAEMTQLFGCYCGANRLRLARN
jgi:hypothetical protein